jgi:hypothetical protein
MPSRRVEPFFTAPAYDFHPFWKLHTFSSGLVSGLRAMDRRPLFDPELVLEIAEVQARGDALLEKAKDLSLQVEETVTALLTADRGKEAQDRA